jgi:hypothetical protein
MARETQAIRGVGIIAMSHNPVGDRYSLRGVGRAYPKAMAATVRHIEGSLREAHRLYKYQQGILFVHIEVEAEGGVYRDIHFPVAPLGGTPIHEEDFGGFGASHRM